MEEPKIGFIIKQRFKEIILTEEMTDIPFSVYRMKFLFLTTVWQE